jgi:hypothetical protein
MKLTAIVLEETAQLASVNAADRAEDIKAGTPIIKPNRDP